MTTNNPTPFVPPRAFVWWNPRTWFGARAPALELAAGRRGYEGAGKGRRFTNWTTTGKSANAEVSAASKALRERSRDLLRNNAYAAAAIRALCSNIVGKGIRPSSQTGDAALDAKVNDLWKRWEREAATSLPVGFYGLQALAVRSFLESGEVIVRRRRRRPLDGLTVPLQIQILEADFIDSSKSSESANGTRIVQGIEFDKLERIRAYHLLTRHPGETVGALASAGRVSNRVRSDDVAHLFEPLRPGQCRGIPWLTPAMRRFRCLDDYEDAELVRKKVEACVAAFIVGDEEEEEGISAKVEDADGNPIETLEPGLIGYLRGGKDVRFNQPHTVGGYDAYKRAELQSIAAAVGMTYELLSGDLSKVNFSSIRAGLIEFRRTVRALQSNLVVPMLCEPVWRWFVEAAMVAGELPLVENPASVYRAKWATPRFEEVDRAKDAKADLEELTSGTATLPDILARRGFDWIDVLDEQVRVKDELEARGLSFPSIPFVSASSSSSENENEEENDETDEENDEADE